MAHPECSEPVKDLADALAEHGSDGHVRPKNSPAKRFIVATEIGMIHPLQEGPAGRRVPPGRASGAYART
jgi:quinolinate synthase